MRVIKFRGLMTTGEWVYGLPHLDLPNSTAYYIECSYRICWNPATGGQSSAPIKNGTLSQFTGLIDKHGVDIYEGDILHYTDVYSEITHVVIFAEGKFIASNRKRLKEHEWLSDNGKNYDLDFLVRSNNYEVIGNIHEASRGEIVSILTGII